MKKLQITLIFLFYFLCNTFAGTLSGAWEMVPEPNSSERAIIVAAKNYLSVSVFEKDKYIRSYGGPFEISEEAGQSYLTLKLEFNDKHSDTVGDILKYKFNRKENEFTIENQLKTTWVRIDKAESELSGLWQITARAGQNGQLAEMKPGPRKTIKIITGTRFQWLAINPETKEFSGTGGGSFTLIDGKYTEKIEFFSRDNSRIGASLSFTAKINAQSWSHSGISSKGELVNEIWTKRQ